MDIYDDTQIAFGDAIKAIGEPTEGKAEVGGYLVVWGDESNPDMVGDWFTKSTYFGAHEGNGADAMIHHGLPLKAAMPEISWTQDMLLPPLKTSRDEIGLFASTVCDLADQYEAKIYELVKAGKLKWSSGAASHTVRRRDGKKFGEIVRWPIIEGSLTPTPCQPTGTLVTSMKAMLTEEGEEQPDETKAALDTVNARLDALEAKVEAKTAAVEPEPIETPATEETTVAPREEIQKAMKSYALTQAQFNGVSIAN